MDTTFIDTLELRKLIAWIKHLSFRRRPSRVTTFPTTTTLVSLSELVIMARYGIMVFLLLLGMASYGIMFSPYNLDLEKLLIQPMSQSGDLVNQGTA